MARLSDWTALPTAWIEDGGLTSITWANGGSDWTAALMVLMVISHHTDFHTGEGRVTYDMFEQATALSRTKIAAGLGRLIGRKLVDSVQRSVYAFPDCSTETGWGKIPARPFYSDGRFAPFQNFTLRSRTELDAMKLYLAIVARRDTRDNLAYLTYDAIAEYIGIERARIRGALSVLAGLGLVHVERVASRVNDFGTANAYRLAHIEASNNPGSRGRRTEAAGFFG